MLKEEEIDWIVGRHRHGEVETRKRDKGREC